MKTISSQEHWSLSCKEQENFTGIVKYPSGTIHTYKNGLLHSFDDKPAIVSSRGYKHWFYQGNYHRINGPALIGRQNQYFLYGKLYYRKVFYKTVDLLKYKELI